jgi:hypothetical protein
MILQLGMHENAPLAPGAGASQPHGFVERSSLRDQVARAKHGDTDNGAIEVRNRLGIW